MAVCFECVDWQRAHLMSCVDVAFYTLYIALLQHHCEHSSFALVIVCCMAGVYHRWCHAAAAAACPGAASPVIVESTYGTQLHRPRTARESQFLSKVTETVLRGGRVLVPIVAIGRAQVTII